MTDTNPTEIKTLPESLTERANLCHQLSANAGWWDNQDKQSPLVLATKLALIHSELSEAFAGALTAAQDDKLPQYPMLLVELADTLIRIYDLAGSQGFDLETSYNKLTIMLVGDKTMPKQQHLALELAHTHHHVSQALEHMRKGNHTAFQHSLCLAHGRIYGIANTFHSLETLDEIILAKLNYNLHRADHKREHRAAEGGKKV